MGGKPHTPKRDQSPGPGAYTGQSEGIATRHRPATALMTSEPRFRKPAIEATPGPGQYAPSPAFPRPSRATSRSALIASGAPRGLLALDPRDGSPGPGAYNVESTPSRPRARAAVIDPARAGTPASARKRDASPGPGQYGGGGDGMAASTSQKGFSFARSERPTGVGPNGGREAATPGPGSY